MGDIVQILVTFPDTTVKLLLVTQGMGPTGTSGYSGISGFSGYSGFCGISGFSGFSSNSGYSGYSGFSGYSGQIGDTGNSGFSGFSGTDGASGASGYSGFSGPLGLSGYSGFSGPSGYSGYCGLSGYSGYSGQSGYSGYCGLSGYSGSGVSGYSGFSVSGYSGYSGTPGGSPTQVQYNNAGTFSGITGATSDGTTLTLIAPILGTPTSGTLTNATGLPITGITSSTSAQLRTLLSDENGTGAALFDGATSPTFVTPALGTPSALVGTNITGTAAAFNINGTVGATTPAAGTFTTLNASSTVTVGQNTGASLINLNGAAGQVRDIIFNTAGNPRWIFRTDSSTESGSNVGSDWILLSRTDAGAPLDNAAFKVTRSNSSAAIGGNLTVNGGTITGGAGNMTITAGTGVSRTLTLRTTTSGSIATDAITIDNGQNVSIATGRLNVTSGVGVALGISSGSGRINWPSNGVMMLSNNAQSDFSRLQFGGTDATFPSLKRSSTTIAVRLADDSADAPLTASNLTASGTLSVTGASTLTGAVTQGAKTTTYNNIATVGNGIPSEVATIDSTGLTANVSASTLYAVPASGAGLYRVSAYLVTTTAASVSSTMPNAQVVYTDSDSNTSVTLDVSPILGAAGLGQSGLLTANAVGTVFSGTVVIYAKLSTTIQYQTVNYASTAGGMAYALRMKLEAL